MALAGEFGVGYSLPSLTTGTALAQIGICTVWKSSDAFKGRTYREEASYSIPLRVLRESTKLVLSTNCFRTKFLL